MMAPLFGQKLIINRGVSSFLVDNELILYVENSQLYLGLEGIGIDIWMRIKEHQPILYEDIINFAENSLNVPNLDIEQIGELIYALNEKGVLSSSQ